MGSSEPDLLRVCWRPFTCLARPFIHILRKKFDTAFIKCKSVAEEADMVHAIDSSRKVFALKKSQRRDGVPVLATLNQTLSHTISCLRRYVPDTDKMDPNIGFRERKFEMVSLFHLLRRLLGGIRGIKLETTGKAA